jgi:hypothetical protein
MPPEDARYEDPCVEDGRLHLRRTLRKARLTMPEASAEECEPAAGRARSSATSALVSGLTGRMSKPFSPRSNTFRGPPCSNPTRRHHSNGNTVWRFRVKVIVVVFMGNILLLHSGDVTSLPQWMRVGPQEEGNRRHRGGIDRALMVNRSAKGPTGLFLRAPAGRGQVPDAPHRTDRRSVGSVQRPLNSQTSTPCRAIAKRRRVNPRPLATVLSRPCGWVRIPPTARKSRRPASHRN